MAATALSPTLELHLPPELEARQPPEARGLSRDSVRMMVSYREHDRIHHARFADLPEFLRAGDLLVLNVSATIPAALTGTRADGTQVAVHFSTQLPAGLTVVEVREARPEQGERIRLPGGGILTALVPYPLSKHLWVASLRLPERLTDYLNRWGRPISYSYLQGSWPLETYQNVYAEVPGSAEMASAGRPFTAEMIERLARAGVMFSTVVLHAGVSSLEHGERPYEEYFEVGHEAAAAVERAQREGGRVIAVGTTSVRALESALDAAGRPIAARGWTDLVIGTDRGVQVVDGLLTGFHEPEATHLNLLAALTGWRRFEQAYRAALDGGYLWHEFGDLHLILPS